MLSGIVKYLLKVTDFLDHVLREYPSQKFLAIKRSFFDENGDNQDLGNGVLAFKGVYQAIRPAIVSTSIPDSSCCIKLIISSRVVGSSLMLMFPTLVSGHARRIWELQWLFSIVETGSI